MGQVCYQDYVVKTVRASLVLTTSYVAGIILGSKNGVVGTAAPADLLLENYNQLNLLVDFTIGSLTSAEIMIEYGIDDGAGSVDYYQETFQNIGGATSTDTLGNHTITATGKYIISVPLKCRYVKVSSKGTGTVTNSLLAVKAILGVV